MPLTIQEQRTKQRLAKLEESLRIAKSQYALSIYGEYGEFIHIPLGIAKKMKTALVECLEADIAELKLILK